MMDEESLRKAKEAIKAIETDMRSTLHIQEKLNQGLGNQIKALQDIGKIEALLKKAQKDRYKLEEEHDKNKARYEDRLREQEAERLSIAADLKSIDADVVRIAKDKLDKLNKQIKDYKTLYILSDASLKNHDKIVEAQKEQLELLKKAVRESNQYLATWNTLKTVPGMFFKGFSSGMNILKPLFEMDKEIRNAARSMNILGEKNFKSFANGLERAAEKTITMGVNVKDLAKMQQSYSEQIGKSVELTDAGNIAMAQMSEGTGLGAEFATQMASEMDKFGASASAARDLVSDTIKKASRMGVNGAAASKKLISLLKLSQTYVFKGGVKALSSMANDAERLRLDLEGAAGLAEKVMRPEGAVETAALLTTMGGEFGKLGDPFQLMFKSRNDFAGFTKDIGKATSEFIDFNKQTGAFEIKGGLARDRMKEISTITGIQMDKLQEMGVAQRKMQMISEKTGGMFSEDDAALLSSLAQVDSNGDIKIKFRGQDAKNLSQVNQGMIEAYKKQSINLEKSAEQARTFDEVISDFIMSIKQQLLPFVQQLKDRFGVPIQNFIKTLTAEGFYTKLRNAADKLGEYAGKLWDFAKVVLAPIGKFTYWLAKFIVNNPIESLVKFLGGWALLKAATWYGNGIALAAGFKSATNGFTSGYRNVGQNFSGGKQGGRLGAGIAGGLLATSAIGAMATDKFTEKGSGANIAGNVLSGIAGGASMGAFGGIPGMVIGGLIGGGLGLANAYMNDGIVYGNNSKQIAKGIKFHPNDKFVSVNDALVVGTDKGGVTKAAETISNISGGNSINKLEGHISHDGVVKHEGEIKLIINGIDVNTAMIVNHVVNDPSALSQLTAGVNESNNRNRSGGVSRGNNLAFT